MDRRIETRVVITGGEALTTLIQKDACEVYWISMCLTGWQKEGRLTLYDGFDANGKLQWCITYRGGGHFNFIPPIPCDYGLTVVNNKDIETYTIAYRGKGWPREQK